jgi:hypothetical protein
MTDPADAVFAFEEGDHLTRIHLKLALEDIGFVVLEEDETIHLLSTTPGTCLDDGDDSDGR